MKRILIFLTVLFLNTSLGLAAQQSLVVEWEYQPPAGFTVSGYRLYLEGTSVCENLTNSSSMDCDVEAESGPAEFTLTALFEDGSESLHSEPYPFEFDDNGGPVTIQLSKIVDFKMEL